MAENENGQEKTEQPTAKRLRESRDKGQVPSSRELNTFVILVTSGTFLLIFGSYLGIGISEQMAAALTLERDLLFDPRVLPEYLVAQLLQSLEMLAPLFVVATVAALIGPLSVGGMNFSTESLMPKLSKLDPIKGLGKVFSVKGVVELGKALGKLVVIGAVAWFVLDAIAPQLMALGEEPVAQAIIHTGYLAAWTFLLVSCALVIIALIDVPYQIWTHNKQLRMTLQEVKDESKDTEGNPQIKGRIRRVQMEMAQRRMMSEVPKADVVITNPTHYAVAIMYHAESMRAPRLLAKGVDQVARAICDLADEYGIPRIEAPQVARAIYFTTELEQEIPAGLFVAVARILAYVYGLKAPDNPAGGRPQIPRDLPVPDEYLDPAKARRARASA